MSAAADPIAAPPSAIIQPTRGAALPQVREALRNPETFWFLARRDIKIRFVQTKLGWIWTAAQPLGTMLVFTFAFRELGGVQSDGVAYPVFAFAGLTLWLFISRALSQAAESLITNAALLTKTPCPRLLMPAAAIAAVGFDLVVMTAMLLAFSAAWGEYPTWRLALAPAVLLLSLVFTFGLGVILSTINVRFRDVRNALPSAIQLLMFVSPVAYSLSTLGPTAETLLALNPLVGIVEAFRWSVLATPPPSGLELGVAIGSSLLLLVLGVRYFSRFARDFADVA